MIYVMRKMVYVLEDDPDICELVAYILSEAGYDVKQCNSIASFNQTISHQLPDIIILDILLPDGNGLEICRQLRSKAETAAIPVLMMSANKTKHDIEDFGCKADFISKPFNIDHFRERVDQFV
jgi:DNA-binding response OmpR family regulator